MRISIALATLNGERFLSEQLGSLIAQTHVPHEVVVSDDGSTDRTLEILEEFRATAPFTVSIRANRTRLGYAENFLQAAAMCTGDFIAFCDQDDVWLSSKLARGAELLEATGALLMIHRNAVVTEDLVPSGRREPAFNRSFTAAPLRIYPWLPVPGNAMVFSRSVFDVDFSLRPNGLGRACAPMTHDEWTYFIATALGSTHFASEVLGYYRQHGGNVFGAPGRQLRYSGAPEDYRFLKERAIERSAFFEGLAKVNTVRRDRCESAAAYYRTLAARLEARASVYSPQAGIARRFGRFARLAATGGYRPRTRGGFGLPSLLKDGIGSIVLSVGTGLKRSPRP